MPKIAHHSWNSVHKLMETDTSRDEKTILNHQNKTNIGKKKSLIAEDDSGNKEPWSNAFNFKKSWGTQVDPRTGTLSAFIKTGALVSNLGHGPNINLQINYISNSIANPDRVGMGWSWNLTHFNPVANALTTSTGKNFHLIQNRNGTWQPLYHKLKDIFIQGNKQNGFIITYANGLRERLNKYGYEVRLEQQDGWGVNFIYASGSHVLNAIEDDLKHKIKIEFYNSCLTVTSYGTYGQPVRINIRNINARLSDISLPLIKDKATAANIHISYDNNRVSQIHYPTGLKEFFQYNCNSAITYPGNINTKAGSLCAVTMKIISLNTQQKKCSISHYKYVKANTNRHDYLGFNSGLTLIAQPVRDILFEASANYTYQTTENNSLVKEVRTYNKYHLLIDDKKISEKTGHIISEVQNFYCQADKLNGCARTSFKDLPANYSFPLKIVTKLWGTTFGKPDISTITRSYDDYGRVTSVSDSYGRTTKTIYCPIHGDTACPAEPKGWPFSNLPETVTVYPAKMNTDVTPLFPITFYYYYHKMPNHIGDDYILVSDHQTQRSGNKSKTTTMEYFHKPDSLLSYGLVKRVTIKGTAEGTLTSVSKDYRYIENIDGYSRTIYKSIELSHHQSLPLPSKATSLFTNQVLQKTDAAGKNVTYYHYDLWGRVIQTDLAVGTPFASHIKYQYTLSSDLNEVLVTAANGVQRKVIMDSAGRRIMDFDEVISISGKAEPGQWRLKDKIIYDNYGRVIAKYRYLSNVSGNSYPLITTYGYDEMGTVNETHLPDGETNINLSDDSRRCTINYNENAQRQHSPISVVISNVLGKPVKQITLPSTQAPLASAEVLCTNAGTQSGAKIYEITYDGFGRAVSIMDPEKRVTRKIYNALGQMTNITDPAGNKTHFIYDLIGKVIQRWYLPFSGGRYLLFSAQYNEAGELVWRAGEDGNHTTYTYTYDGKLQSITTPDKHTVSLKYNILNLPVAKYADGKLQSQIDYDPVTLLPIKQTDNTGVTIWSYTDDNLLWQTIHTGSDCYLDYQFHWQYDQNRRVISATDIHGYNTQKKYDYLGRATELYYQNNLLSSTVYDGFSRIIAVHYGSGMKRTIRYDNYNHQQQVSDTLNHHLLSQWNYTYDVGNNIIKINQRIENNKTSVIHYRYDRQNNLVSMSCDGSAGLPLCPRDTSFAGSGLTSAPIITRQDYFFTPLNRIAQLKEVLQNTADKKTLSKTITYDYSNIKTPLRPQSINIKWNKKADTTHYFSYDEAGNMVTDGEGNRMTYNIFNQLTSVVRVDGKQSLYHYDSNGKEVKEQASGNTHYLFYRDNVLINETINNAGNLTYTMGYYGIARTTDGVIDQYYEKNYKYDITGVLFRNPQNHSQYQLIRYNIYSPYGMSWHQNLSTLHSYVSGNKQPLLGFDGERTDPVTHWLFLGAGHRTYNPNQRCFLSEDPEGDGYRFGNNNPIMNIDPTGNIPKWLKTTININNEIMSLGLTAIHKKWANITASVILGGLAVAGSVVAIYGGDLSVATISGVITLLSSVTIAAAAVPANKGMNIATAISGALIITAVVATTTSLLVDFASRLASTFVSAAESDELAMGKLPATELAADKLETEELATDLGRHLKAHNSGLKINRSGFTDYLAIESDEELVKVRDALERAAFVTSDLEAVLIAAKISGHSINLRNIEAYISIFNQITQPITEAYMSEITEARDTLFSQFGRYNTNYVPISEILYNERNYLYGNIIAIVRFSTSTRVITGSLNNGTNGGDWFVWSFNEKGELMIGAFFRTDSYISANLVF